ncbi:nucleoside deaminase [Hymenobacter aerilatus]|uniref:tRNA-specific adenosine deaminase n=1 Tax=Hymenobacter aerilatus TaxID=2932251 RepID=A0A8T9SQX5_9BACT|nr:nucleoside deaminase [Hymenobacter aerilatus]UOR04205.1 nucleoside deaminase [Hymenobacter aerilatus]
MTLSLLNDDHYMREALKQARYALAEDEIPIGAVVVLERQIIARAYNQTEKLRDVTAHAEMLALTAAANHVGNKYLADCTLYVTVEPCVMCAGATAWAQVRRVVYGADEPKVGYRRHGHLLHPRAEVVSGVLAEESSQLLREFFARKRKS